MAGVRESLSEAPGPGGFVCDCQVQGRGRGLADSAGMEKWPMWLQGDPHFSGQGPASSLAGVCSPTSTVRLAAFGGFCSGPPGLHFESQFSGFKVRMGWGTAAVQGDLMVLVRCKGEEAGGRGSGGGQAPSWARRSAWRWKQQGTSGANPKFSGKLWVRGLVWGRAGAGLGCCGAGACVNLWPESVLHACPPATLL